MTRERTLLLKAADALEAGSDPFSPGWLADNEVTSSECFDLSENIAKCIRVCTGGVDWNKASKEVLRRVLGATKSSAMSKKLTVPQRYVLQTAADHVVLQVGGLDGANVKRRVVMTLYERGLLESWPVGSWHGEGFRITDAGKAALSASK